MKVDIPLNKESRETKPNHKSIDCLFSHESKFGLTVQFNLSKATSLGEGKHRIQTCSVSLTTDIMTHPACLGYQVILLSLINDFNVAINLV